MAVVTTYICDHCGGQSKQRDFLWHFSSPKGAVYLCHPCQRKIVTANLAGELVTVVVQCDTCKGKGQIVTKYEPTPEYGPCPKCSA